MKWVDIVHLALYNLTIFNAKKYYDLDTVIIPYVNNNWHTFQLPPKVHEVTLLAHILVGKVFPFISFKALFWCEHD